MELIRVNRLTKRYKQAIKDPGLGGAVKHLFTQKYREKIAVNHINLSIDEGEAVAYVGPNGAGKSTTIKMLSGILIPTSGEILVDGIVPFKNRVENAMKIGAVFGQRTQLWWDLPVSESFSLLKDIYEIPENIFRENMHTFSELLALDEFMNLTPRKISLGQRMRADIAAALLHNPRILYLDEPTIGLDIAVKERVRQFIKQVNVDRKTTIMLTTHDLEEIEDICNRLVIIDKGFIIYDGTFSELKDKFARDRVIHFQMKSVQEETVNNICSLPGVYIQNSSPNHLSVGFDRFMVPAKQIVSMVIDSAEVQDFKIDEPKIDNVILKVYEGSLTVDDNKVNSLHD